MDITSVARHEAVKREVNEAIEDGLWQEQPEEPVRMRCECGSRDCIAFVSISVSDYERVREHPRRFIVAAGHQIPAAEAVVARTPTYSVVEKVGEAGEIAERSDPRSTDA